SELSHPISLLGLLRSRGGLLLLADGLEFAFEMSDLLVLLNQRLREEFVLGRRRSPLYVLSVRLDHILDHAAGGLAVLKPKVPGTDRALEVLDRRVIR